MNANAFRHFYDYHFAENRKLWGHYVAPLPHEQFTQHVDYSRGSVRDQILHLISCDDAWFSGLRGVEIPADLNPADFLNRESIRAASPSGRHLPRTAVAGDGRPPGRCNANSCARERILRGAFSGNLC